MQQERRKREQEELSQDLRNEISQAAAEELPNAMLGVTQFIVGVVLSMIGVFIS
jgi:hypothetical protein